MNDLFALPRREAQPGTSQPLTLFLAWVPWFDGGVYLRAVCLSVVDAENIAGDTRRVRWVRSPELFVPSWWEGTHPEPQPPLQTLQ
jgi:hypothetical protein